MVSVGLFCQGLGLDALMRTLTLVSSAETGGFISDIWQCSWTFTMYKEDDNEPVWLTGSHAARPSDQVVSLYLVQPYSPLAIH